ncbi:hypothetical protein LZ31DRAFT_549777 [Colletotrichum somersetense]|nr:hypothetical protein LZ31DRAFT_549777 [Colletotrichum somersetense]
MPRHTSGAPGRCVAEDLIGGTCTVIPFLCAVYNVNFSIMQNHAQYRNPHHRHVHTQLDPRLISNQ